MCTGPQDGCVSRGVTLCHCCQRGKKAVGRGALIAGRVLVLPSMPKGEIVDLKMI